MIEYLFYSQVIPFQYDLEYLLNKKKKKKLHVFPYSRTWADSDLSMYSTGKKF